MAVTHHSLCCMPLHYPNISTNPTKSYSLISTLLFGNEKEHISVHQKEGEQWEQCPPIRSPLGGRGGTGHHLAGGSFVLQAGSSMKEMAVMRWHGGGAGIGKSRFAPDHTEVVPWTTSECLGNTIGERAGFWQLTGRGLDIKSKCEKKVNVV